jgi:hypothetical protein
MTDFSPKFKKIQKNPKKSKLGEITENHVLGSICTQKGQKITKLDFWMFLVNGMSSIALGIWVGFLKQPALPGEAPQKKMNQK